MIESNDLKDLNILVIDDTLDILELLNFILSLSNANVITASSSEMAVEEIKRHSFDIILCDISMPGEDGYSLIRRIRKCSYGKVASIPVIAVTAYATKEDKAKCFELGFQGHISKPIEIDKLSKTILEILGKKIEVDIV